MLPTQGSGVTAELHLQLDIKQHFSFTFTVTKVEMPNVLHPNIHDQVIIFFLNSKRSYLKYTNISIKKAPPDLFFHVFILIFCLMSFK